MKICGTGRFLWPQDPNFNECIALIKVCATHFECCTSIGYKKHNLIVYCLLDTRWQLTRVKHLKVNTSWETRLTLQIFLVLLQKVNIINCRKSFLRWSFLSWPRQLDFCFPLTFSRQLKKCISVHDSSNIDGGWMCLIYGLYKSS